MLLERRGMNGTKAAAIAQALREAEAAPGDTIWVIGGAETYRRMMPVVERIDLTIIDAEKLPADRWLDLIDGQAFRVVDRRPGPSGGPNRLTSTVVRYVRMRG